MDNRDQVKPRKMDLLLPSHPPGASRLAFDPAQFHSDSYPRLTGPNAVLVYPGLDSAWPDSDLFINLPLFLPVCYELHPSSSFKTRRAEALSALSSFILLLVIFAYPHFLSSSMAGNNPPFIPNPYGDNPPYIPNQNYIIDPNDPNPPVILNPNGNFPRVIENPYYNANPGHEVQPSHFEPRERERRLMGREPMKGGKSSSEAPNKPRNTSRGSGKCSDDEWKKRSDPHYR
ncbi:hypothetical protein ABKV19_012656 [Rosa sericea]